MSELWYREFGFNSNPFSIKPAAFTNEVIGHNLKAIFKSIEKGQLVYVMGPFGTGKTTILKHIIGRYGGERRVVYYNCSLERSMQVGKLISGAGSMVNRLIGGAPKNLIFLIDEATDIIPKDAQNLFAAYNDGVIKSIVFVGVDVPSRKFPPGLSSELKDNIINLHNLPPQQAVQLVRARIGSLPLLSDNIIKELHKRAGGNTRLLLEYCEELCRLGASRNLNTVSKEEVEELFPATKKMKIKKSPMKKRKRMPLDESIEEAVFEVESDTPVVEGLAPISENESLPSKKLYDSPLKRKRK